MTATSSIGHRETVFVTHAAPQDNEFALWISSKLAIAGYRVWVDKRRLRGGDDFWDEIDRVLRTEAVKQVIVFSKHHTKPGVKKELAIGEIMKTKLSDPKFMIPIRIDDIPFSDAPPEIVRDNILEAHPNWHDCLADLFQTLHDAGVPKASTPEAAILKTIVDAREEGRRFITPQPEDALTNWFPIRPPSFIRYYRFDCIQEQMLAWLQDCKVPVVHMGRLIGTFCDSATLAVSSSFPLSFDLAYEVAFDKFIKGEQLGPYIDRSSATNDIANLLRQHFSLVARGRGLLPVEFANGETGWFFPDDLVPGGKLNFVCQTGRRIRRTMSGKFKTRRWHICLLAKPRIWPALVMRIHGNVVISEGGELLAGERTHTLRRRLTKSWWNDVWRDRLLASMYFLSDGRSSIEILAGAERFEIEAWPLTAKVPASYVAADPPLLSEEDDEGNIVPTTALDDQGDDLDTDADAVSEEEETEKD